MGHIPILKEINSRDWNQIFSDELQAESTNALENGRIVLFPQLAFTLLPHENKFLSASYRDKRTKNISYHALTHRLQGVKCSLKEQDELKAMMRRFMQSAEGLVQKIFPAYSASLQRGRTSFRPVEILGRVISSRKDDTRLHVDAFPATPNQGRRILRVFSNINPNGQDRFWRVGESFENVAHRFLPRVRKAFAGKSAFLKMLGLTKSYRTEYDHLMLCIHDGMKRDLDYQKNVSQQEIHFAPGNTWIVQTDHVSHAAMAGQHVLEQTFYLPVNAMIHPELSPLRTLEKLMGKQLSLF
ncbi:MAG TPA: Kdo hydroxylase family protein [Gammaproteobacteria bacterium]|nr:Kdo hydroxylase family protein [Gammaproteobacteria bacterium]